MIEIRHASFRYAGLGQTGLHDIDLTVAKGECVLLCGASGCGKTTLTRLMNGLIPHYYKGELSGKVSVGGRNVRDVRLYDLAGVVGSVFQNPRSQFFSLDTDGEVIFGPENIGLDRDEILRRKKQVVDEFRLRELLGRSLFELSGGEKQKIACASVAALMPEIIILDEPSSNLDWDSIADLRESMRLWKSQEKTVVISEHRLWYLKDLIDRAVFIREGRIAEEWGKDEFRQLTERQLRAHGLRPIELEKRYIRQFSRRLSKRVPTGPPQGEAQEADSHLGASERRGDPVRLRNFYFSYTAGKCPLFRPRAMPNDMGTHAIAIGSLELERGCVTGLIGRNGSGKTTLLRCLCGLEKSCHGVLAIGNEEYHGRQLTRECYMVMQDVNHQLFTDSVRSELLLSMDRKDDGLCDRILESLDLAQYKETHPMALSGGQKQRLAIASAIAADARVLLLDEPTSGLDYRHMREVCGLLRSLAGGERTILVSTHDPELVALCCDCSVRLDDGCVIEMTEGTPSREGL